ncbi:TRF-LIKE 3 [Salix viminalis]|uniref:TRF-LIKE 3 n=1 Tax=Salix viminalis TaxID=40686 RepID=A0A9Q0T7U9_SALVM|nr:TRF-LIKE 3 [Salix viminalis]
MGTVVEVEGNDEAKLKECGINNSTSLSSPKQISDPVVYKLVRLEGDGRIVPATDDELIEVESLLIDEKCEMHVVADPGQTVGCISNEGSSTGIAQLESLEGLLQSRNKEAGSDKLNARLEETVPSLAPSLSESHFNQSGSAGECSHSSDNPVAAGSTSSAVTTKPDFSKLKGEICLDNLSIKELHETFKATFGRETTVKDKQWLKRRISMGLTNSCDVSVTSFIIKDNKLVKKENEEISNCMDGSYAEDQPIGNQKDLLTSLNQLDYHQVVPEKRLENPSLDDNSGSDDHQTEQRAAKRVRKPTKRYIEELSEVEPKESNGRLMNLAKTSGHGLISLKSHVRPVRNVILGGRTVVTRLDSLGGYGIEVPCVSRVRRSRPRKNFMALLKFNPSGMGTEAMLVKKVHGDHSFPPDDEKESRVFLKANSTPEHVHHQKFNPSGTGTEATSIKKAFGDHSFPPDDGKESRVLKVISTPEHVHHQFIGVPEKDKQFSVMSAIGLGHNMELKCMNSSGDSDDNVVTVPTPKGGIRRKHHRAWTLSEVMKLVEGVSSYGAGRWSEIKRLEFASYSYRTSVDLKDKWRNLLKASLAQTPQDNGMNSRKNTGAMPIPTPILLKVRELAEMQAQVLPNLSSTKIAGSPRKNVHEKQTGFL